MPSNSGKVTPWLTAIALPLMVLAFAPAQLRQPLLSDLPSADKIAATLAPSDRQHRRPVQIGAQIGGFKAAAIINARSSVELVGSSGAGR